VCERVAEESAVHLAAVAARDLLAGRGAGWVNLRRDGLGLPNRLGRLRRPVRTALVLGALLLAVVCGGAWYRAGLYRGAAQRPARSAALRTRRSPRHRLSQSVRSRHPPGEGNQNDLCRHFGLGTRVAPVDLEILWPGGDTTTLRAVEVDRVIEVVYGKRPLAAKAGIDANQ